MAQTRTSCPRCKTPLVVEIEQLFDLGIDPQAKQKLLSGAFNVIVCKTCGYQGMVPSPIVYHDPGKEMLLTHFPPELGLPVNEQERLVGPLINQVVNKLPLEKRKAYLLRPQTMLTMQTMIDTILQADGITKEMLDEQQKRLNLVRQLLMTTQADSRATIIKQEEALIDENLFGIISRLAEMASAQGDQQGMRQLATVQQELLNQTKVGQALQSKLRATEEAVKSLQEAGKKGLTRESLLDLIIEAPTETHMQTLVSLARNGLDYQFFQLLSNRIETSSADKRQTLLDLREKLLKLTTEIDQAVQQRVKETAQLLEKIITSPDIRKATEEALPQIDEAFVEILQNEIQNTRKKGDLERSARLQQVMAVLEEASTPPPELELINKLASAQSEEERQQVLNENAPMVTQEFIDLLNNLVVQSDQQDPEDQDQEGKEQLQAAYRSVLRFSMQANLNK